MSDRPFQLSLPIFQGPVEGLVALVADRKLSVDDVRIAAVTAQFSAYLDGGGTVDLEQAGDFVSASARLLVLKSARLLAQPVPLDERANDTDERDFERWQVIERVAVHLGARQGEESFAPTSIPDLVDRPLQPRPVRVLPQALRDLFGREQEAVRVNVPAFVRLEVALSTVIRRVRGSGRLSLRELLRGARRNDVVVHFLAVLELARRRQVVAHQDGLFADILLEQPQPTEESGVRAG